MEIANPFASLIGGVMLTLDPLNVFIRAYELEELIQADHVCHKCASTEEFEELRGMFKARCLVDESIVSGRRIAYIRWGLPFVTFAGPILFLELSDQKPDGSQKSGVDHIELCPKGSIAYTDVLNALRRNGMRLIEDPKPHHPTWNVTLESGLVVKFTPEPLLTKIQRGEVR